MSVYLQLHQVSPQRRFIRQAVDVLRAGGVIVYPTDSCYALGCHIGDKAALERIRDIRQTDRNHHFTLVCRDLAEVGKYAMVDNWQYRLLRAHTPGPYTFLLKASRETPRRLKHERRGTIGLRVPDHPVTAMLLGELGEPVMRSTLLLPGEELPLLFAITLHEVAHGRMARYFGDRTAEMLGRLSLNPLRHIDPIGTVLVPGLLLAVGGLLFGWAKPVPVATSALRSPRRAMVAVALAGPAANFLMAVVLGAVLGALLLIHGNPNLCR